MKVLQHQQCRLIVTSGRIHCLGRFDGRQRVVGRVSWGIRVIDPQSLVDVPAGELPAFIAAKLADLRNRLLWLSGFDPDA